MSDNIPSEVYREILLRLPADSLLRFRSVCKTWCQFIDDPSFVKSHTRNYNYNSNNTLLIRNETGAPLYLFNLDSIDFTESDRQLLDAIPVKQLIRPGVPRLLDLPTTACNGLILISSEKVNKTWAIWNPLTRECHQLPPAPPTPDFYGKFSSLWGTGLGFDYATDDFKVVRIDRYWLDVGPIKFRALVYSLKLGCWGRIKDCPCPDEFWCGIYDGVFLNGALHWIHRWHMIIVLDLGTEDYRQMPLPPIMAAERQFYSDVRLDAVGGCLTLSYIWHHFDGWVMKDYGGAWTKLFTLDLGRSDAHWMGTPRRLVAYLERKGQVILQRERGFLWYDIENDDVKQVTIHDHTRISSSQICPGSLYRLDDGGGVSRNVATTAVLKKRKRKRTKKIAKTRLKFCVRDCGTYVCSDYSCHSSPSPPPSWYYEGEEEDSEHLHL